jgi:hypothetical protein
VEEDREGAGRAAPVDPAEGVEVDRGRAEELEIEDGHLAIVQAQLDSVQGMGFWFDVAEFRLETE